MAIVSKVANEKSSKSNKVPSDLYCKPSNQARKSVSQLKQSDSKTGTKVLAKKKTKSGLPREVDQLLQDEGAERIMQEMEGKLTSRKRTPTKGYSFVDTGDAERLFFDKDEKVQKKIKRPRTKSLTAPTADSFHFGLFALCSLCSLLFRNSLQTLFTLDVKLRIGYACREYYFDHFSPISIIFICIFLFYFCKKLFPGNKVRYPSWYKISDNSGFSIGCHIHVQNLTLIISMSLPDFSFMFFQFIFTEIVCQPLSRCIQIPPLFRMSQ